VFCDSSTAAPCVLGLWEALSFCWNFSIPLNCLSQFKWARGLLSATPREESGSEQICPAAVAAVGGHGLALLVCCCRELFVLRLFPVIE
jgi:hypothetical protein